MKLYKLTNKWKETRGETLWGEGVKHSVRGNEGLCTSSWIHAYESPLMAVAMDPAHTDVLHGEGILWEARGGRTILRNGDLKCGVKTLTTLRIIEPPTISLSSRLRWAIMCARATGVKNQAWLKWSEAWLSGKDRSHDSAGEVIASSILYAYRPEAMVLSCFGECFEVQTERSLASYWAAVTVERSLEITPSLPALKLLERAIAEEEALGEIRQ